MQYKYEQLGEFCFIYRIITYTDRFCKKFLQNSGDIIIKEWGAWPHTHPRRLADQVKSKWLRDDRDDDWESKVGRNNGSVKLGRVVTETGNENIN